MLIIDTLARPGVPSFMNTNEFRNKMSSVANLSKFYNATYTVSTCNKCEAQGHKKRDVTERD